MFLTGRYPHHHSKGSKQQGKNKLHHILCATQYKFHRYLLHISVKCNAPNKTYTHYSYLQKCLPDKDILLKLLSPRLKYIMLLKLLIILSRNSLNFYPLFPNYSQPSTINLYECATRTTISYL